MLRPIPKTVAITRRGPSISEVQLIRRLVVRRRQRWFDGRQLVDGLALLVGLLALGR